MERAGPADVAFLESTERRIDMKKLFEYHPDKAKQLLVEAGYPNGFKTSIIVPNVEGEVIDGLSIIKAYWAKIGVDLTIDMKDTAVWNSLITAKTYDQMCTASRTLMDPVRFLYYKPGHTLNRSMVNDPYCNEHLAKIGKWEYMTNPSARVKLMNELAVYTIDQAYEIQFPARYDYAMWQPWIGGYHGEYSTGYHSQERFVTFIWVDQDVKDMYTGKK